MYPILPPSKPSITIGELLNHNDAADVDKHEKIELRTALMSPLASDGPRWLTVGHAVERPAVPTVDPQRHNSAPASTLAPPSSPLASPIIITEDASEVPELTYANSAPSEEDDFEIEDPSLFPAGDDQHSDSPFPLGSPSASFVVDRSTYKPDAALVDLPDDPFHELRMSLTKLDAKARSDAEDEMRAYEVHTDMMARLQEGCW